MPLFSQVPDSEDHLMWDEADEGSQTIMIVAWNISPLLAVAVALKKMVIREHADVVSS